MRSRRLQSLHLPPRCTDLSITIPLSRLTLSTAVSPLPTLLTASPAHQTSPSPISVSPLTPSPEADPCNPFSLSFHHSSEGHPIPHLCVSLSISLCVPPPLSPSASLSVCHLLLLHHFQPPDPCRSILFPPPRFRNSASNQGSYES